MKENKALLEVLDEVGDISGWTVFDLGSGPCTVVACLAKRIGDGRVFAVDLYAGLMDTLRKALSEEQLLRTIALKTDLRRLDFLADGFVDLVTAYDTLSVVEQYTPGGTPYVLNEARRILKPKGWFVVVEHFPLASVKPVDEAQDVEVRWWRVHVKIAEALGETTGVEHTPDSLQRVLRKAGFTVIRWKRLENEGIEPGMRFGSKMVAKAKLIADKDFGEDVLREMRSIEREALKYGMRELPRFAVYARNPESKPMGKLKRIPLNQLYDTVRHRELLF
jgi:ubiquinone/menaquinone biosynthesis C-methylase UbiE